MPVSRALSSLFDDVHTILDTSTLIGDCPSLPTYMIASFYSMLEKPAFAWAIVTTSLVCAPKSLSETSLPIF